MSPRFNLVTDPWINVIRADDSPATVSLRELFTDPTVIRSLDGDLGSQDVSITRLLLAIMYRALDLRGDPVARWEDLYQFPVEAAQEILPYLDSVTDRFDILSATAPFYQVAGLESTEPSSMTKTIPDFDGQKAVFSQRSIQTIETMSLPEAARWLIHLQGWDPVGIKTGVVGDKRVTNGKLYGPSFTTLIRSSVVLLEGENLWHTLLLNFPLDSDLTRDRAADLPAWEREPRTAHKDMVFREPHPYTIPGDKSKKDPLTVTADGIVDYLTWQSRWVRLLHDGERVTGLIYTDGDASPIMTGHQQPLETQVAWQEVTDKDVTTWSPVGYNRAKELWQGIDALTAHPLASADRRRTPARNVAWFARLAGAGVVSLPTMIRLRTVGFGLDPKMTRIQAAADERLTFTRPALVEPEAVAAILDVAKQTGLVARRYEAWVLAALIAGGLRGEMKARAETARTVAHGLYASIDVPFRSWVSRIRDSADVAELHTEWGQQLLGLVRTSMKHTLDGLSGSAALTVEGANLAPAQTAVFTALRKGFNLRTSETDRSEEGDILYRVTVARIHRLNATASHGGNRGDLADLRRGETDREALRLTVNIAGQQAMSTALTLYALHQRGTDRFSHLKGRSLGSAVQALAAAEAGVTNADATVLTGSTALGKLRSAASSPEAAEHHLRAIILRCRTAEVPLDFGQLAVDLYHLHSPATADTVGNRWGAAYFSIPKRSTATIADCA